MARAIPPVRDGLRRADISRGNSLHPIPVINQVDSERFPTFFTYTEERKEDWPVAPEFKTGCECPPRGCKKGSCSCIDNSSIELTRDGRVKDVSSRPKMFTDYALHECSTHNCACAAVCSNRMTPSKGQFHHRVEIYKHPLKGYCCRTQAGYAIRRGEYVCDFVGEALDAVECDRRDVKLIGEYSLEVTIKGGLCDVKDSTPFTIDPYAMSNVSRFMPHACFPNLVCLRYFNDHRYNERPRVGLVAARDIPPLTDLSIDYGVTWWVAGAREFTCACGWKYCRYQRKGVARQFTKAQLGEEEKLKRNVRNTDHETVMKLRRH